MDLDAIRLDHDVDDSDSRIEMPLMTTSMPCPSSACGAEVGVLGTPCASATFTAAEGLCSGPTLLSRHSAGDKPATTLTLRNIPESYDQAMLLELLDSEGFSGQYHHVSLFGSVHKYAFVPFTSIASAVQAHAHFTGFRDWKNAVADNVCAVHWTKPLSARDAKDVINKCKKFQMAHAF
jgi:hypothetical protein